MQTLALGVPALSRDRSEPRYAADAVEVTLAASGDAQAFERLYRRHVTRIHNLVRRMHGPDDSDEVTQDVFVRAWEKLGTFRGESAFSTWLHRLAVNVILTHREARGKRRNRFSDSEQLLTSAAARRTTPEAAMDLENALSKLPDGAREVFVLHDVEGYRHEEIADMLGLATGTSKSQLHHARMALRAWLD
ncbi:MAG: sigma-70 family RNA polymerase sigma factor [Gemmatimonadales bacterium]|jgi:RNA polymerase sigma-70 factor (ECF subfamily)|nr:MAG: sigma-70 family RNA polymerase sigma factor [Gemmatimonadales bacterium]